MQGYQLTFYTQEGRYHGSTPLAEWLMDLAKAQGALGATLFKADESFGHHGRLHAARFFELAEQPVGMMVAVDELTGARLLSAIESAGETVFYVKIPVEYGRTGSPD